MNAATQANAEGMQDERLIRVFDMPVDTTAEEAERLLNLPDLDGFYVNAVLPWPGVGARVILKRHAKTPGKAAADSGQTKEARAMQFLREHREMTVKELAAAFKAIGFVRSVAWISTKRAEVVRAERRVT